MLKPKENKKSKAPPSPCDPKRILQAVSILKQLNQKYYEKREKKSLLDDESENPIILQLTMKKIPPLMMQKFIKVHLPKSILTDKNEVCLITGDLDKHNTKAEVEPDVLHFKELLKKENISQVNEVITLRQLRKEYKPFEARRQLCGAYDIFLCDKKIAGVLPNTLGKCFFKKRKLPIQINMKTPKLKEQIENALSSTVFHITCRGNSCASEVANLSMSDEDILPNIMSSIDVLKEQLPGQWDNVLGIYVKTPKSKAIPLYMSNDDPNDFNFAKKRSRPKAVSGELSTLPSTEVKVFRDGRVVLKKAKKEAGDSESDEEYGFNDSVKQSEVEREEMSFPPASDGEEVNSDTCPPKRPGKKSKKRKSNLELTEGSSVLEVEEEKVENSDIEKNEKKSKKRKSNLSLNEKISEVEVNKEEEVENSKIENSEKKIKKHKSDIISLNEGSSEVEVNKEDVENSVVEKSKKKSKKRKSNLTLDEENAEVVVQEESIDSFETEKRKKKSKNHNSNLNVENSEVEINEKKIENSKAAKLEKKSRKCKSNSGFNNESTEVAVKEKETEKPKGVKLEIKKRRNLKSDLIANEESEVKAKENTKSLSLKSMKNKRKIKN